MWLIWLIGLVWFRRLVLLCRLILLRRFLLTLTFLLLFLFDSLLLLVVFLLELLELSLLLLFELLLSLISLLLLPLLGLLLSLIGLPLLPLIWLLLMPLINLRLLPLLRLSLLGLLSLIDLRLLSLLRRLLPLVGLWRSLRIGVVLLQFLALLDLLLLDSLALLILSQAQILDLLLLLLFEPGIAVAGIILPRRRRAVVVAAGITWPPRSVLLRVIRSIRLSRRVYVVRGALAIGISLLHVGPVVLHILSRSLAWRIHLACRALAIGITLLHVRPIVSRILRRPLPYRRRHPNVGTLHLNFLPLLNPAHLGDCRGPATILAHNLLLLGESYRSRRRRRPGHNGSADNGTWRSHACCCAGPEDATLLRCHGRCQRSDRCRSNFPRVHADHVVVHRPCGGESLMRGGRHGVHLRLVLIPDVGHVDGLVHVDVVVHVGDVSLVDDGGVGDVHPLHVALAHVVGWAIHVARPQREPRNARGCTANSHANPPMRTANPSY